MNASLNETSIVPRRTVLTGSLAATTGIGITLGAAAPSHAATTLSLTGGDFTVRAGKVRDANQGWRSSYEISAHATVASWDALPFEQFDVPVRSGQRVSLVWRGTANPGQLVRLLVWNAGFSGYDEVASTHVAADGSARLEASVDVAGRLINNAIRVVVQHSVGYAGGNLSFRDSAVTYEHPDDTPRSAYDFTLAWETDTQYYNEQFPQRQLDIHDYLLRRRRDMNLQYLFHTGDIVDEYDQPIQWERADAAYRMLDRAALPYGVLGGNHDVGQYDFKGFPIYSNWFGSSRFAGRPWYGGSHQNNRGHFDLINAGGHDFLMLYMTWMPGADQFAWMNQVLAAHPERTAIICVHNYLDVDGSYPGSATALHDQVVAKNPNVRMVIGGHYHGALHTVHRFSDGGSQRTVHNVLFDYQDLPEGGQSFVRLMHFDNRGGKVLMRTYSPYLKRYSSTSWRLQPEHQEFTVPYSDLGLRATQKKLATTELTATLS